MTTFPDGSGVRPRVVAVIPARGGSKGLPGKNLARVGGVPLVARAIASALPCVDKVVVSTDDPLIARVAQDAGAVVVWRPAELADDATTSEAALLHALESFRVQQQLSPLQLAKLEQEQRKRAGKAGNSDKNLASDW